MAPWDQPLIRKLIRMKNTPMAMPPNSALRGEDSRDERRARADAGVVVAHWARVRGCGMWAV